MTPPLKLPHNRLAEQMVVSAPLNTPTLLDDETAHSLEPGDLLDSRVRDVFGEMRNLQARGEAITIGAVAARLRQRRAVQRDTEPTSWLVADVEPMVRELATLTAHAPPTPAGFRNLVNVVRADAAARRAVLAAATDLEREQHERAAAELDARAAAYVPDYSAKPPPDVIPHAAETAERSAARESVAPPRPPRWRRARDLVDSIIAQAGAPSIALKLGCDEIVSVRPGGIVQLIGASGSGKTSITAGFLVEHAQHVGPAIAMSLELPGEEFTGRVVGMGCDASWLDVLTGRLPREHMIAVLPERLVVISRADASTGALREAIEAMRAEYPGEPILCAVDYVQLMAESTEREIRRRIADAMVSLDGIARDLGVAVIALSQGSRVSARALSSGTALGSETTDAGAEAAELERWSTATLAIGPHKLSEDKSHAFVDLSLGKYRMGLGDRVRPMRYEGKSGRWRAAGEWRSAADVRAEQKLAVNEQKRTGLENELLGAAMRALKPLSVEALCKVPKGEAAAKRAAVRDLLARGDLVRVMVRAPRSKAWLVWTPTRAAEEGIPLAPVEDDDV